MTPDERAALIERYAAGPARLRAAVSEAPEEMRHWRPEPGEFSVHEIALHCADSEANAHMRIRYLLAEDAPVLAGYDADRWATTLAYAARPLGPALAVVDAVRANTVPLLRLAGDADWARSGTHTESGPYSAEDWLRIYAAHCHEHAEQVERVVAAWRAQAGERD